MHRKVVDIISKVDHLEVFGDIVDFLDYAIMPNDLRFSDNYLHMASITLKVKNGRYAFAQALSCWDEPKIWSWPSSLMVAENTLFNGPVDYGSFCTIGGAGFGYVRNGDKILRMPHIGEVEIGNRVVLHSHVNIDRGVIGSTIIGHDSKIDSFVHIAHGVKLGKGNTLASHTIIEGSCQVGDGNTFGTSVVVQRKVKIGNNNTFGSGTVVVKDIGDNGVWVGNPARQIR